jgi:tetratricopeptide (TPR) repeat protein
MPADRLETLKSLVAQDPGNAFLRYGLAMEYVNSGRPEQAVSEFEALLAANPDYAAGYYHAGRTLEKLERLDDARQMYERGIEVTARSGDAHTRSELQAALDMLGI